MVEIVVVVEEEEGEQEKEQEEEEENKQLNFGAITLGPRKKNIKTI